VTLPGSSMHRAPARNLPGDLLIRYGSVTRGAGSSRDGETFSALSNAAAAATCVIESTTGTGSSRHSIHQFLHQMPVYTIDDTVRSQGGG